MGRRRHMSLSLDYYSWFPNCKQYSLRSSWWYTLLKCRCWGYLLWSKKTWYVQSDSKDRRDFYIRHNLTYYLGLRYVCGKKFITWIQTWGYKNIKYEMLSSWTRCSYLFKIRSNIFMPVMFRKSQFKFLIKLIWFKWVNLSTFDRS